jgi:hypothetical protein
MLNQSKDRSRPVRSASMRAQSTSFNQSAESASCGTGVDVKTPELAVELQHLHELKRQVAAQEQKLAALRAQGANGSATCECGNISFASLVCFPNVGRKTWVSILPDRRPSQSVKKLEQPMLFLLLLQRHPL